MTSRTSPVFRISALVMILLAGHLPVQASRESRESAEAEVIAVEDITPAGCELLTEAYADDDSGEVIDSWAEPCPPATNLRTFPTTEDDALARGLIYTPITGDPSADAAAVESVVESVQANAVAPAEQAAAAASCRGGRFSKSMLIRTYVDENGTPGATILSKVWFWRWSDRCDLVGIVWSRDGLYTSIPSSQKLYWYRLELTRPYDDFDAVRWPLCPRFTMSNQYFDLDWQRRSEGTWWARSGTLYKDKLVNSIRLGCDYFVRETYPNQMRLP